jgi:hypothetical protein
MHPACFGPMSSPKLNSHTNSLGRDGKLDSNARRALCEQVASLKRKAVKASAATAAPTSGSKSKKAKKIQPKF